MISRINQKKKSRRGTAMLEVSLLLPLVSFLFVGALDLGYYAFALISLENALRVAALYTSTSASTSLDLDGACRYVISEMNAVPNVGGSVGNCAAGPLKVSVEAVSRAGGIACSKVSITYDSLVLIPIPGLLANQFSWTRSVTMPVRS